MFLLCVVWLGWVGECKGHIVTSVLFLICAINPSFFCSFSFGLETMEPILCFFFLPWFFSIIESEKFKAALGGCFGLQDGRDCLVAPSHCLGRTSLVIFGVF